MGLSILGRYRCAIEDHELRYLAWTRGLFFMKCIREGCEYYETEEKRSEIEKRRKKGLKALPFGIVSRMRMANELAENHTKTL